MTAIVPLSLVTQVAAAKEKEQPWEWESVCGGAITVGNFDGVHLGHADLLREVRRRADALRGPAVAVVLDPHPAAILRPESAPPRLTWLERRAERMSEFGIDAMVVCSTSLEFLSLTADAFFQSLVVERLKAREMVEGPNFYFGRNREGDVQKLRQLCESQQIGLRIIEPSESGGEMVSSTRIRALLESGVMAQAVKLLGAPYRIRGMVASGARRGRTLGFPTANLTDIDVMIPGPGVYGGYAVSGERMHMAAVHIGPNPTFESDESLKVEVHLLDYDGDLYGQTMLVDVVLRVRDIARFDSAQSLVGQLNRDVDFIRTCLTP